MREVCSCRLQISETCGFIHRCPPRPTFLEPEHPWRDTPSRPNPRSSAQSLCPGCYAKTSATKARHRSDFRHCSRKDIGYARVSTAKQDLGRQLDALAAAGMTKVFADKKLGARRNRSGLQAALEHARARDVIVVVHTLDRLGRTIRGTLNLCMS